MGKTSTKNQRKKKPEFPKGTLLIILIAILLLTSLCTVGNMPSFITDLFGKDSDSKEDVTTPSETPASNILLQDDFSNINSGWETFSSASGEAGYADGVYFVKSLESGILMWGVSGHSFSDISIEVTATQINSPTDNNNQYGVLCRASEAGAYIFNISGDGYYSIERIDNGAFVDLVEITESDKINTGNATNNLKAECKGSTLTFYVNGDKLAQATDTTYTSGDIALAAVTYEEEATEIHFDNLVVTRQ
jgi:hypothetical protein